MSKMQFNPANYPWAKTTTTGHGEKTGKGSGKTANTPKCLVKRVKSDAYEAASRFNDHFSGMIARTCDGAKDNPDARHAINEIHAITEDLFADIKEASSFYKSRREYGDLAQFIKRKLQQANYLGELEVNKLNQNLELREEMSWSRNPLVSGNLVILGPQNKRVSRSEIAREFAALHDVFRDNIHKLCSQGHDMERLEPIAQEQFNKEFIRIKETFELGMKGRKSVGILDLKSALEKSIKRCNRVLQCLQDEFLGRSLWELSKTPDEFREEIEVEFLW